MVSTPSTKPRLLKVLCWEFSFSTHLEGDTYLQGKSTCSVDHLESLNLFEQPLQSLIEFVLNNFCICYTLEKC